VRSLPVLALIFSGLISTAYSAPSLQGYDFAERTFQSTFPADQRLLIQELLIVAGYVNSVPNEDFGPRIFTAIQNLQREAGLQADGVVNKATLDRLFNIATPMLDLWGFRRVVHPSRGISLWVPADLRGMNAFSKDYGLHYEDDLHRIKLDFTTVPNAFLSANYEALTNIGLRNGADIHYRVIKDGWFVISSTTTDGGDHYMRYHQDGSNVTGFTLSWYNNNGNINAERIAILMSASLRSSMTGVPFIGPTARTPAASQQQPQTAVAKPATPPETKPTALPQEKKPDETKFSSGTAFFIAQDGTLVTNAHVIDSCTEVQIKASNGSVSSARVLARDTTNDLALIKIDKPAEKIASLRIGARLGEGVSAFGFPHTEMLATSGNFTLGNITALSGMGDDSRFIQISTPVQAGNSGGPLLDQKGNLVGVVTAKLNALKVAMNQGDLPQNVNFAVKTAILATFLDSNRVAYETTLETKTLDPADLADRAREISAFILCH